MTTTLTDTHAHQHIKQALELLANAQALLAQAQNEPSLEPATGELDLIRAAKMARTTVNQSISTIIPHVDRDTLPPELVSQLFPRKPGELLDELRQVTPVTVFDRA